ncbi:uncharacterized protein LOC126903155 isoform X2 [Daktulosphaira vitifoliae]|uniref:uncharacterized protein LOC126903155 isoform X2 n=2 Tax=Daktulosphaira vitifoliae TaxID=58002 RepID=UPI0021AA53EF|nr:uncharacterized protein LOC126903155 isoform X2 [Daktulosphaira vitifoliae]
MDVNCSNSRKFKRGNSTNGKTRKQLENELNRQRSFFVSNQKSPIEKQNIQDDHFNKNSNQNMGVKKPSIEIYRPPTNGLMRIRGAKHFENISDNPDGCKLNVHAKEFTLERSRTAPQSIINNSKHENTNKNIGKSVLSRSRTFFVNNDYKTNNQKKNYECKGQKSYVQPTKNDQFTKNYMVQKVHFNEPFKRKTKNDDFSKYSSVHAKNDYSLRRSKSYNGPDTNDFNKNKIQNIKSPIISFNIKELIHFPEDINNMAKTIVNDTKNSPGKDLMLLALKIIEHAVSCKLEDLQLSINLSLYIIERDTRDTFINMIINTVQLWFVKREKLLSPPRLYSYATFVLLIYKGMKQNKVLLNRMEHEYYSRKQALLMLLAKICEHCLILNIEENSNDQVDCMFGIIDAIGSDLERDIPDMIQQLYVSMRDVVLTRDCSIPVKKTLLHLIELRAFKWVLPESTFNYYNALKLNDA